MRILTSVQSLKSIAGSRKHKNDKNKDQDSGFSSDQIIIRNDRPNDRTTPDQVHVGINYDLTNNFSVQPNMVVRYDNARVTTPYYGIDFEYKFK